MTPEFELFLQVILETLTLFALLVGLLGLIVPVFPGLVVMWLGTLVYAFIQNAAGNMTGWDWFLFGMITVLMITGNIADNLIIARQDARQIYPLEFHPVGVCSRDHRQPFLHTIDRSGRRAAGIIPGRNQQIKKPRCSSRTRQKPT